MIKFVVGLGFFVFLPLVSMAQDSWKEYVHADLGMAFSMPADPTESVQSIDSAVGKIALHEYVLDQGKTALLVGMNVYPDEVGKRDPKTVLQGARDGSLGAMGAKLVSEKDITIDGHPGIEFHYSGDKCFGIQRMFMVGASLYQLDSVASPGATIDPGTDRFLSSFRLTSSP